MDGVSTNLPARPIGGLVPDMVPLDVIATSGNTFTGSWCYVMMSVVFVCLTGLVAITLRSETVHAAFYAGLFTPMIIVAKNAAGRQRRTSVTRSVSKERTLSRFDSPVERL